MTARDPRFQRDSQLSFRLPGWLLERIEKRAKQDAISRSEVVYAALKVYLGGFGQEAATSGSVGSPPAETRCNPTGTQL